MTYEAHLASTFRNMQKFWKRYILIKSWFCIQLKLIFRAWYTGPQGIQQNSVPYFRNIFGKKIGNMVCDCYCNNKHVMSSSNSFTNSKTTNLLSCSYRNKKNSSTNSYLRLWFTQGPNQWAKIYRTQRRTDYYCGTKKPLCSCLASTSCKSAMSHRIACP